GSRLFVQRSIYAAFVDRLVARTKQLRVGDPLDPATHLGPLISEPQRNRVESYVALAVSEGGRVSCGGKRPEGAAYERGTFFEPTIIEGLDNGARVCQEEIFGPVLAVTTFKNEAEALQIANDTMYGLGAGVWTRDTSRAFRMGRGIQAGRVWTNCYHLYPAGAAFGGYKVSGVGRENHKMMLDHYTQTKCMLVSYDPKPLGFF
ncbi:MAG TPA: aldehyde dehydrogenase family protein, partial [Gaiellaceae bacterium]